MGALARLFLHPIPRCSGRMVGCRALRKEFLRLVSHGDIGRC
jgi:hypothetical protein